MSKQWIYAVIGAWHQGGRTFYVRRSENMENYPNVWSLLSIQFDPAELRDHSDLDAVQTIMERLSLERLGGVAIHADRYLTSAMCGDNPTKKRVFLHLYQIRLDSLPELNPRYYSAYDWLTPEEYVERSKDAACGLCMRMWSDYCMRHGLAERPFAPALGEQQQTETKPPLSIAGQV